MFPAELFVCPGPVMLQKHSLLVTMQHYTADIHPCAKIPRMQHKGILGAFQIQQKQSNH